MKILVISHEYPPIGGGGGRVAQDISEKLQKMGHEIHVLTANCDKLTIDESSPFPISRVNSLRTKPFKADLKAMFGFVIAGIFQGLKIIRSWKPDVIHTHFAVPAGAAAWVLSKLTGTPYVLTVHLGDVPGGVPQKTGKWFRWIYPFTHMIWNQARQVTAISEFTKNLAEKHYSVPIDVIPNGVDTAVHDPTPIQSNPEPGIVFAGRLTEQKNPFMILKVLNHLKDYSWKCHILGDGDLKTKMEEMVKSFGLSEKVQFHGWVSPEEVIEAFKESDILFMPSLSEGLSIVGVQALSMGLAMIMSNAGGNPELIENGNNGYLHRPEDEAGFTQSMKKLLSNPETLDKFRKKSRQLAAGFDLDYIAKQYEKVLLNKKVD